MKITIPNTVQLAIALCGAFAGLFALVMFNQHLLMAFPKPARMLLMILTQWLPFLIPGLLMLLQKERIRDFGFTTKNIPRQIAIGILLELVMTAILTVLPILMGLKDMVGSTSYTHVWQFVYQYVYTLLGVAFAEELLFRGYLFHKLLEIKESRWFAIIVSSILFGLFHIFSGNPIQIIMTALMGFIYCMLREKIKGCTLLSLIVIHGLHDATIVLCVALL